MATYLNTNWTEKIKTNPVANRILNSNKTTIRPVAFHFVDRYSTTLGTLREDVDKGHREDVDIKKWEDFKQNYLTNRQLRDKIEDKRRATRKERQKYFDEKGTYMPAAAPSHQWGMLPAWVYEAYENGQYDEENTRILDYWANTYVKDYINIDHPKLRPCYISAMSKNPLHIKPPSVFFSDV